MALIKQFAIIFSIYSISDIFCKSAESFESWLNEKVKTNKDYKN